MNLGITVRSVAEKILKDYPPNLSFFRWIFDALYLRRYFKSRCSITIHHQERLPKNGPVIFVCNHASLVDAVIVQFSYPLSRLFAIRPTGAWDFFARKGLLNLVLAACAMRLCFLERGSGKEAKAGNVDTFKAVRKPLRRGKMIVYFPQGTRGGEGREEAPFLPGICYLAREHKDVPVIPILLRGTRQFHPKGVPFWTFCPEYPVEMYVGEPFICDRSINPHDYVRLLEQKVMSLEHER